MCKREAIAQGNLKILQFFYKKMDLFLQKFSRRQRESGFRDNLSDMKMILDLVRENFLENEISRKMKKATFVSTLCTYTDVLK
jgi:hypothetical protein